MKERRTQAERSESTQRALVETGRRLFTEHGYQAPTFLIALGP